MSSDPEFCSCGRRPEIWLDRPYCESCFIKFARKKRASDDEKAIRRLIKKGSAVSETEQEHIYHAAVSEAIRILSPKKGKGNAYEKVGTIWANNNSITFYTSDRYVRSIAVYGHNHKMVNIGLETKHDVDKFLLKAAEFLGKRITRRKNGSFEIYIGKLR